MNVLIIANAHRKGGLSGSDAIYQKFAELWPARVDVWHMKEIDFKPFTICYIWRIVLGCWRALWCSKKYDAVYSASDFLMDSLPAFILKLRGIKWIAGFYLYAFRPQVVVVNKRKILVGKWQYHYSQQIIIWLINKYADMVIVTNPSMYGWLKDKHKSWINGGIDLSLTHGARKKNYDAVFCGRIHWSKGIYELREIWESILLIYPDARLAIIGDGDTGKEFFDGCKNVVQLGYMGDERFEIYKQSAMVLYMPTVDHFSMAPVEAMACGCVLISIDVSSVEIMNPPRIGTENKLGIINGIWHCKSLYDGDDVKYKEYEHLSIDARQWAQQFSWDKQVNRVWEDIQWLFL
jgi:glycosyltransferase involved in cell wall biosynthesis